MRIDPDTTIIVMPEKPSHESLQAIKAWLFDFYSLRQIGVDGLCERIYESLRDALERDEQNVSINITWSFEDVQAIRPDLTPEQANTVLKTIEHKHDASTGINWDTLEHYADQLFPANDT